MAWLTGALALAVAAGGALAAAAAGNAAPATTAAAATGPAPAAGAAASPPPAPAPGASTVAPVQAPGSAGAACVAATASVADAFKEPPASPGMGPGRAPASTPAGAEQATTAESRVKLVRLGDVLVVELDTLQQLQALLAEEKCSHRSIVLFLDDRPLKDALPFPPTNPSRPELRFMLRRTAQPQVGQATVAGAKVDDPREVWTYVLGGPSWDARLTRVSVGFADGFAFPSQATVGFEVIPHGPFVLGSLLLAVLLIGFLVLAAKSDLLRDSSPLPGGGARRPFSLARTQAAWWFFLTLASYLFIGEITGDFSDTITGTVLVLLGISAGTALGAAAVDASQSNNGNAQVQSSVAQALAAQVPQMEAELRTMQSSAQGQDPQALQAMAVKSLDLAEKRSQLKKLRNESETFLIDILSDANGVNFHRFQIAAWTVVLGIIFVAQVYRVLAMPTFDSSLLALMGISSGTYVGLKITEPTVPTQMPPPPPAPPAR